MRITIILMTLWLTSGCQIAGEKQAVSFLELNNMEKHYKDLLIKPMNNHLIKEGQKMDPKYIDLLAECHLASINIWPVKFRFEMLEIYKSSQDITSAMKRFEHALDKATQDKELKYKDMNKYVNMQSIIYDGSSEKLKSQFWQKKLKRSGIIE